MARAALRAAWEGVRAQSALAHLLQLPGAECLWLEAVAQRWACAGSMLGCMDSSGVMKACDGCVP